MIEWILTGLAVPAVGWALSVESRLRGQSELKESLEEVKSDLKADIKKVSDRQEDLIDFLLRDAASRANKG